MRFLIRYSLLLHISSLFEPTIAFIPQKYKTVGGVLGVSHIEQTERAIKALWVPWFGRSLTEPTSDQLYGLNKAIEEIGAANALVDNDQTDGALHFDGESFTQSQERLIQLAKETIYLAKRGKYSDARRSMGGALHTLQDFYSHSNWIELLTAQGAKLIPHPGVGVSDAMLHPLALTVATCENCKTEKCGGCDKNLRTDSLTSGYYSGEPDYQKPSGAKCSHGGPFDRSTRLFGAPIGSTGQGINKDSIGCVFSPHADLHYATVEVAIEATKIYLTNEIVNKLDPDEVQNLFGYIWTKKSFSSVFDDLWDSMKSRIMPHKREVSNIAQKSRASTFDHNIHTFVAADAVDEQRKALVRAVASHKLHPVQYVRNDGPENEDMDAGWRDLALATGGHLLKVYDDDIDDMPEFLKILSQSNHVEILSVAGIPNENDSIVEFSLPLDSTLESVLFSASGVSSFDIYRPNGSLYSSEESHEHVKKLSSNVALRMGPVTQPGIYRVALNCTSEFSLSVSGKSRLYLEYFSFVEEAGRPGHEGRFPVLDSPIAGQNSEAEANVHGGFKDGVFEFRTKDNKLIAEQDLMKEDEECKHHGTRFQGDIAEIPATDFMVYFRGLNDRGEEFQRARLHMVSPAKVRLTMPRLLTLKVGETHSISVGIKNFNNISDTFDVFAVDSDEIINKISRSSIFLDAGASGTFTILLDPAHIVDPGMSQMVVSAKGHRTRGNFAVQKVMIQPKQLVIRATDITHHYFANATRQLIQGLKKQSH
ncbi:hypothetical protein ABW20_dc0101527 [Dactylellina cionopaga]|nr:hypothetical protein ABW20_dc0101527 [Dactylellina cionopaga]